MNAPLPVLLRQWDVWGWPARPLTPHPLHWSAATARKRPECFQWNSKWPPSTIPRASRWPLLAVHISWRWARKCSFLFVCRIRRIGRVLFERPGWRAASWFCLRLVGLHITSCRSTPLKLTQIWKQMQMHIAWWFIIPVRAEKKTRKAGLSPGKQ